MRGGGLRRKGGRFSWYESVFWGGGGKVQTQLDIGHDNQNVIFLQIICLTFSRV